MRSLFCALAACWLTTLVSAGVRPDATSAYEFGVKLQTEFAKRHGDALVSHLNTESLRQRVFSSFDTGDDYASEWTKIWNEYELPPLVTDLKSLGVEYSLILDRVGFIDHARWLQCVIVDQQGRFRFLELRLCESGTGAIAIDDLRFGGATMEVSRILRQTLLLLGIHPSHTADAEELQVAMACERYLGLTADLVHKVAEGDLNTAFQRLRMLPEEVQRTAIIQNYRNRLALLGHEGARNNLRDDLNSGRLRNAFLRFSFPEANDPKGALAIVDQLAEEYHGSPFLRTVKADTLTSAGEPEAGLTLAEEVYTRNPFCFTAYLAAIRAAVALHKGDRAMLAIAAWSRVFTPAQVHEVLATDKSFGPFQSSPAYKAWQAETAARSKPTS